MARLHFIGGEKGGVGKSVLSRVLAQYCIDHELPFVGYDSDQSHGSFRRFYEAYAAPVALDAFNSIDAVVEQLCEHPEQQALVDLAAQSLRPLGEWISSSGVLDLLSEEGHGAVFWHVMDDGVDALQTLGDLLSTFGASVQYVVVLNHGRGKNFAPILASDTLKRARELGAQVIELPALHDAAMHKIDQSNASFWAGIHNPAKTGLGLLERRRVRVWQERAFAAVGLLLRGHSA